MCHDVSPQAFNPSTGSGQPHHRHFRRTLDQDVKIRSRRPVMLRYCREGTDRASSLRSDERSRSPESAFTFAEIGVHVQRNTHSPPWLRFQSPLIEPDGRFSRIRLSDEIMPSPTESSSYAVQGASARSRSTAARPGSARISRTVPCACDRATGAAAGWRAGRLLRRPG